jgi:phosphomevalonate kinase
MIEGVGKYAQSNPAAYRHAMDKLRDIAERFVAELAKGSAKGAVTAAGQYGRQLELLGTAASVPIVTPAFLRASDLAKDFAGIAKPSGAGGGDIGVAMFPAAEAARRFARALPKPLVPLDVDLDRRGVRRRVPDEQRPEDSGLFHA